MKINFSKFLNNRAKEAEVPAAKFKGQSYAIGASSYYDEDESEDVRIVRPSKDPENVDDSRDDLDIERNDSEMDNGSDEKHDLDDHALDVVINMLGALCDDEQACEKMVDWVQTCDCLSDSDRDYLLDVLDDISDKDYEDFDDDFVDQPKKKI